MTEQTADSKQEALMQERMEQRARMLEDFRRQQEAEAYQTDQVLSERQQDSDTAIALQEEEDLSARLRKLGPAARRRTLELLRGEFEYNDLDFPPSLLQEQPGSTFTMIDATAAGKAGSRRDTLYMPRIWKDSYVPSAPDMVQEIKTKGESKTHVFVDTQVKKLKPFSGKKTPANGELDYRHWRRAAVRIKEDAEVTLTKRRKIILESLTGKADDIIDFHKEHSLTDIFEVLDANYKHMVDGDDLLADFYQMVQDEKAAASDFLSDLYVELVEVVKEDGATLGQMQRLLLKQFIRGCRDDDLILKLGFEKQISNPPDFPFIMSQVRREEARRTERKLRLKRGMTTRSQAAIVEKDGFEAMQQRLHNLEAMASRLEQKSAMGGNQAEVVQKDSTDTKEEVHISQLQQRLAQVEDKLSKVGHKYFFCYKCGMDYHVSSNCRNSPNKTLVKLKVEQRKSKDPSSEN